MKAKNEILKDFYILSDYLKKVGKIEDLYKYKKNFSAFLSHAIHIKAYDFVIPFCKHKSVLDIGCFIGYGEMRIFSYVKEIVAVDNDEKALEFACKNKVIQNVKFEKADAGQLPFLDETFDIVIAFQLIEHILPNEVLKFLFDIKRVLKKKGLLFITTPNRKFRLLPFQRPFNPEHYQEFTPKGLLNILKLVFEDVQLRGVRSKEWIEEIERKRIRKSPYQVYLREPLLKVLPVSIKSPFQKIKSKMKKKTQYEVGEYRNVNNRFKNCFQKFSMDDFYLQNRKLDKSIDLFAICKT